MNDQPQTQNFNPDHVNLQGVPDAVNYIVYLEQDENPDVTQRNVYELNEAISILKYEPQYNALLARRARHSNDWDRVSGRRIETMWLRLHPETSFGRTLPFDDYPAQQTGSKPLENMDTPQFGLRDQSESRLNQNREQQQDTPIMSQDQTQTLPGSAASADPEQVHLGPQAGREFPPFPKNLAQMGQPEPEGGTTVVDLAREVFGSPADPSLRMHDHDQRMLTHLKLDEALTGARQAMLNDSDAARALFTNLQLAIANAGVEGHKVSEIAQSVLNNIFHLEVKTRQTNESQTQAQTQVGEDAHTA